MATPAFPVSIQTMVIRNQGTTLYYPQVFNMQNPHVQQMINQTIYRSVQALIQQQTQQQGAETFTEMLGTYELKTNERNVLSLSLSNYAYAYQHAHGLTLMKSLTFDVLTGKSYSLKELFKPGSNYVKVLSALVKKQIKDRQIETLDPFTGIRPDQDFYIADKCLVLYFQLYEITPYYVGFPMFPISVYEIQDIIAENGPLARMAVND
ncbi:MAG TPA: DUF3298 domain-containing protein [Bacillales bacterium]|nr:DUF3298 domain-containing protein [Bacillales bacterium]